MSLRSRTVLHHARRLCAPAAPGNVPPLRIIVSLRSYATHANINTSTSPGSSRPTAQSLLANALDQRQRAARREDSAGPFSLGITPPRPGEVKPEKKWSELSAAGKVVRTTARTSNLVVILAGAGLSIVLIYALTSELFSPNSPTVLYNKACRLISASPQVKQYLHDPLVFHNHPPVTSGARPRHRNHYVSSQIFVDSSGREHMLLNFYVHGSAPGFPASNPEDEGMLSRLSHKVQGATEYLQEMSAEDMKEEVTKKAQDVVDASRGLFRFLAGSEDEQTTDHVAPVQEQRSSKEGQGWFSSVTGLFSGIKGSSRPGGSATDAHSRPAFTEGEVHADLVMNDQGYYEFRYLLIDMPNSNTRNPRRVFIERKDGVRETEPIVRWHR